MNGKFTRCQRDRREGGWAVGQTQDKTLAGCFHQIMYAGPYAKHFTNIKSFEFQLLLPLSKGEKESTERLSDLLKVTQLVSGRDKL